MWGILFVDKGYDYEDVHVIVGLKNYIEHIKHRRSCNEPRDIHSAKTCLVEGMVVDIQVRLSISLSQPQPDLPGGYKSSIWI
jgi:hypothetical protein